jgi:hypothetical protein
MKKNFTINDLLLFQYNELPQEELEAFEVHLIFDEYLKEMNQSFINIRKLLDTEKTKPSETSIRLIMDYNRQNSIELEAI